MADDSTNKLPEFPDEFTTGKKGWYKREYAGKDRNSNKVYRYFKYEGRTGPRKADEIWEQIGRDKYESAWRRKQGIKKPPRVAKNPAARLSNKFGKALYGSDYLNKKNGPWNRGNRLRQSLIPLALSSEKTHYRKIEVGKGKVSSLWGTKIGKGRGGHSMGVLNGFKEWRKQLQIARHRMSVQGEHFRITVGQRALRVFQLAFKYHKFYNEDTNWVALAPFTRKKRLWRGTWKGDHNSKLFEYGALAKSLTLDEKVGNSTRVRTKRTASSGYNKKNHSVGIGIMLAGIHNEGVPKGNKWGKAVPQRQFMGWSKEHSASMDKIDRFAYEIADRYLFDGVFLTKKPSK